MIELGSGLLLRRHHFEPRDAGRNARRNPSSPSSPAIAPAPGRPERPGVGVAPPPDHGSQAIFQLLPAFRGDFSKIWSWSCRAPVRFSHGIPRRDSGKAACAFLRAEVPRLGGSRFLTPARRPIDSRLMVLDTISSSGLIRVLGCFLDFTLVGVKSFGCQISTHIHRLVTYCTALPCEAFASV